MGPNSFTLLLTNKLTINLNYSFYFEITILPATDPLLVSTRTT